MGIFDTRPRPATNNRLGSGTSKGKGFSSIKRSSDPAPRSTSSHSRSGGCKGCRK